jgi:hypothetical protein
MNNSLHKITSLFLALLAFELLIGGFLYERLLLVLSSLYIVLSVLVLKKVKAGIFISKLICVFHLLFLSLVVFFSLSSKASVDPEAFMTVFVKVDHIRMLFIAYIPFVLVVPCVYLLSLRQAKAN